MQKSSRVINRTVFNNHRHPQKTRAREVNLATGDVYINSSRGH